MSINTNIIFRSSIANQDNPLLKHLHNNSVMYEIKHLSIGDYLWICIYIYFLNIDTKGNILPLDLQVDTDNRKKNWFSHIL